MDDNLKQAIDAEYKRVDAFLNGCFSKEKLDEADKDVKVDEKKLRKDVAKLHDSLVACKTGDDISNVIDGLKKALSSKLNEDENAQSQADMLNKLLEKQQVLIDKINELEKKQDASSKEIKKLKGSILKKLMKQVMHWGAIVLLVAYGYSKLPSIVKTAVDASMTAVKDDISIVVDAIDGNTKTINRIAQDQVKVANDLAAKIEKNHEDVVKLIDTSVSATGKLMNMFLSKDEIAKKYQKQIDQLQADINEWKNLDNEKDKADQAKKIEDGIEKIDDSGVDSSVKKLKVSLKAAWHDIGARLTKAALDESIDVSFKKQVAILNEATMRFKGIVHQLNEAKQDDNDAKLKKTLYDIWDNINTSIKSPEAAEAWYLKNKDDIERLINDQKLPTKARKTLSKAFAFLKTAIEKQPTEKDRKSFLKKHWLKIIILIFLTAVFLLGGLATYGAAVGAAGAPLALSNVQVLTNFLCGGWAFLWRAILGILTSIGIVKFFKWWLFR